MKAGAICLRWHESQMQVLLVRSSHKRLWVFPKGSQEPEEPEWMAAQRELEEETGWTGFVDSRPLGSYRQHEGESISAYLVKSARWKSDPEPGRDPAWVDIVRARGWFQDQHDPETALSMVQILWGAIDRWQTEER